MRPSVSVAICTHNPKRDVFARALSALASQSLPHSEWELVVIDNDSTPAVNLATFPLVPISARVVSQPTLGLMNARTAAIDAVASDLVVFVDDDNVLAPDYLERAVEIAATHPFLGAWGGQIVGEFEVPPPAWSHDYVTCLALRQVSKDQWSNSTSNYDTVPFGAGLCVRADVARAWASKLRSDPLRLELGRRGGSMSSAEDTDLSLTACDMGLGCGLFSRLQLTHLISKERLSLPYFERLMEGIAASALLLKHARGPIRQRERVNRMDRLVSLYRRYRMSPEERTLQDAIDRGREAGYRRLGL